MAQNNSAFKIEIKDLLKPQEPKKCEVILFNDDYTTFEFVIEILKVIFTKTQEQAEHIAYKVHSEGKGVCGIYVYDIAELKAKQAEHIARKNDFPLKLGIFDLN